MAASLILEVCYLEVMTCLHVHMPPYSNSDLNWTTFYYLFYYDIVHVQYDKSNKRNKKKLCSH